MTGDAVNVASPAAGRGRAGLGRRRGSDVSLVPACDAYRRLEDVSGQGRRPSDRRLGSGRRSGDRCTRAVRRRHSDGRPRPRAGPADRRFSSGRSRTGRAALVIDRRPTRDGQESSRLEFESLAATSASGRQDALPSVRREASPTRPWPRSCVPMPRSSRATRPRPSRRRTRPTLGPRFGGLDEAEGTTDVLLSSIGSTTGPRSRSAELEVAAARRSIASAWRRYLESICRSGPLVVVLEDIHWAEPGLLELLESLAAQVSGPLVLVCTARPEIFERRSSWGGGLPNASSISLRRLSTEEGEALIGQLLGGPPPAMVVGPLLDRSDGNPFFVGELLRMVVEDGTLRHDPDGWTLTRSLSTDLPDTIQGVIASRLDLLPPGPQAGRPGRCRRRPDLLGRCHRAARRAGRPGGAARAPRQRPRPGARHVGRRRRTGVHLQPHPHPGRRLRQRPAASPA